MIFIPFSCFVVQSLKLHVLKLTNNIDDLKLQLVSYLFSMFSFYSFFLDFFFLVNSMPIYPILLRKLMYYFLIQVKDEEANNKESADEPRQKFVSHLMFLLILCPFCPTKITNLR